MIKWQIKFRAENSNVTCIENNYSNYIYTVIGSLLVVVIQRRFRVSGVDNAVRMSCERADSTLGMITKDTENKRENIIVLSYCLCPEYCV